MKTTHRQGVFFVLAGAAAALLFNQCAEASTYAALGAVIAHTPGTPASAYVEIRAERGHLSAHAAVLGDAPRVGVGLVARSGRVSFGVDVVYASPDAVVGTPLRYGLRAAVRVYGAYAIELRHESNCRYVCQDGGALSFAPHGPDNRANAGYTGLVISKRF